jgi:multisite-specific tRNA:(cytosine-C5)-methyltransferase
VIEKIDMENVRFSAYYKAQKIVPDEEWDTFIDALRQHLPTTFRVAGSRQYVHIHSPSRWSLLTTVWIRTANILNTTIKNVHVPALSNVIFEDQLIPPPVQIPW